MFSISVLLVFCFISPTDHYAIRKDSPDHSDLTLESLESAASAPITTELGVEICDCDIDEKCYVKLCEPKNKSSSQSGLGLKYKTLIEQLKSLLGKEQHSLKLEVELKVTMDKPKDSRQDQSLPDLRGDEATPDSRRDLSPTDTRGDPPPDSRRDPLSPKPREDRLSNGNREENIFKKRIQWLLPL